MNDRSITRQALTLRAFAVDDVIAEQAAGEIDWQAMPTWIADAVTDRHIDFHTDHVVVVTSRGNLRGEAGDLVSQGVNGEFCVIPSADIAATIEP